MKEENKEKLNYTVVRHDSLEKMLPFVEECINEGYIPCGGICYDTDREIYIQAMVLRRIM